MLAAEATCDKSKKCSVCILLSSPSPKQAAANLTLTNKWKVSCPVHGSTLVALYTKYPSIIAISIARLYLQSTLEHGDVDPLAHGADEIALSLQHEIQLRSLFCDTLHETISCRIVCALTQCDTAAGAKILGWCLSATTAKIEVGSNENVRILMATILRKSNSIDLSRVLVAILDRCYYNARATSAWYRKKLIRDSCAYFHNYSGYTHVAVLVWRMLGLMVQPSMLNIEKNAIISAFVASRCSEPLAVALTSKRPCVVEDVSMLGGEAATVIVRGIAKRMSAKTDIFARMPIWALRCGGPSGCAYEAIIAMHICVDPQIVSSAIKCRARHARNDFLRHCFEGCTCESVPLPLVALIEIGGGVADTIVAMSASILPMQISRITPRIGDFMASAALAPDTMPRLQYEFSSRLTLTMVRSKIAALCTGHRDIFKLWLWMLQHQRAYNAANENLTELNNEVYQVATMCLGASIRQPVRTPIFQACDPAEMDRALMPVAEIAIRPDVAKNVMQLVCAFWTKHKYSPPNNGFKRVFGQLRHAFPVHRKQWGLAGASGLLVPSTPGWLFPDRMRVAWWLLLCCRRIVKNVKKMPYLPPEIQMIIISFIQ